MTDIPTPGGRYVTAAELSDLGLTPKDVRHLYPWAVEYTALDGSPCWLRTDLTEPPCREGGEPL